MRGRAAVAVIERERLPDLRQQGATLLILDVKAGILADVENVAVNDRVAECFTQVVADLVD